jgi:hypothetical protein
MHRLAASTMRRFILIFPLISTLIVWSSGQVQAQHGSTSNNMALVGFNDLQNRSAYQPLVHQQGRRWIAYIGHHGGSALNPLTGNMENNGTSIVEVTDPANPVYLRHLPGPSGVGEAGGAQMVRVCNGTDLPGVTPDDIEGVFLLRAFGDSAHQVWDVRNPANPVLRSTPSSGLEGTHKSDWECDTGIAYLVSGVPGWRVDRMTQIFDLSNPRNPVHIRDYGLVGQEPGSTGDVPTDLHGPLSKDDRVYFGHGTSSNGIVQIVDRLKLITGCDAPGASATCKTNPTPADLRFPIISQFDTTPLVGAHTTFPIHGVPVPKLGLFNVPPDGLRDILAIVNESTANECSGESHQMLFLADVTIGSKPQVISSYYVPDPDDVFCRRGGRFGAHSSNESYTPIYYGKIVFIAYFNAGVRAVDIRDPFRPKEVGFYVPATTDKTDPRAGKIAIQTNNVEVDDRGLIYIVDRANTGMHILQLTGDAAQIVNGN